MVAVWLQFNIQFYSMAELSRSNRIRIILPHILGPTETNNRN